MQEKKLEEKNFIRTNAATLFVAIFLFVISLTLTKTVLAASYVSSPEGTAIRVTMINQEPNPVDAGQYVKLRFRVENIGTDTAKNVVFDLLPKFPFSLDPGTNATSEVGTLEGIQIGNKAVILEYRLRVDERASSGSNEIQLRYRIGEDGWILLPAFNITVRRYFQGLSIESITSEPRYVEPGKEFKLKIELANLADSFMKDVSVSINLSSATIPFVPLDSGTERRVLQIMPGDKRSFEFKLLAAPNANFGVHKIPLLISYKDESNNNHSKSDVVGIIVNQQPILNVELQSTTIDRAPSKGKITLKIVNAGLGDISFLRIKLEELNYYKILSARELYIGEILSDDYETEEFTLYVENTDNEYLEVPITLYYLDVMGNSYEQHETTRVRLYSSGELRKYGLKKGSSGTGVLITLIIIILGIVIYKKRGQIKRIIKKKH